MLFMLIDNVYQMHTSMLYKLLNEFPVMGMKNYRVSLPSPYSKNSIL